MYVNFFDVCNFLMLINLDSDLLAVLRFEGVLAKLMDIALCNCLNAGNSNPSRGQSSLYFCYRRMHASGFQSLHASFGFIEIPL